MNLWPFKKKDRTYDFEGRCTKCGKGLNLIVYVSSPSLVLLRLAEICADHPKNSGILWPASRDDIVGVEYDKDMCSASSSPSPSEYDEGDET